MKNVIEKWYHALPFPEEYDRPFYELLNNVQLTPCKIADYLQGQYDCGENLLMFLYFCENLAKAYKEKGIEDAILFDTLEDLVRWTKIYTDATGKLGLEQVSWMGHHMQLKLFKLGRLQFFRMENVLDVHIPQAGPLNYEQCVESFALAKEFFEKYIPEHHWEKFICHSWLLDPSMLPLLGENSNIEKFQTLFTPTSTNESDAAIRYIFGWYENRESVAQLTPKSGFAKRVQDHILSGGKLYEVAGWRAK